MTNPSLEERKTFWKWCYATRCFTQVKSTIEHVRQNAVTSDDVGYVLLAGIVATYAKPFTKCYGVGSLDNRIIPRELLKQHECILDLRHKAVAHIDAVNYKADDLNFGNINRVEIFKNKTEYGFTILSEKLQPTLETLRIHELCSKLIEKTTYHTARFEKNMFVSQHFHSEVIF